MNNIQNIIKIEIPTWLAFPPLNTINVYLIKDEPYTLIDAGPKMPHNLEILKNALKNQGINLKDIKRLLITHGHIDHFGLAHTLLKENPDLQIFAHKFDAPKIKNCFEENKRAKEFFTNLFFAGGIPENILQQLKNIEDYIVSFADEIDKIILLADGDEIKFENFNLKTIFCPGHSSGLICFYAENEKIIFSTDHLLPVTLSNPVAEPPLPGISFRFKSLVHYLDSLNKINKLNINYVYPGHGNIFENFNKSIIKIFRYYSIQKKSILKTLTSEEKTLYQIARILIPENSYGSQEGMFFYKIWEILGVLEVLEEEKLITSYKNNGLTKFTKT